MKWFKKKEEKKVEEPIDIQDSNFGKENTGTKTTKSSAKYKVIIKESLGKTTRTVRTIEAERFIDEDDNVVYLRSVKDKFFEVFPEDHKDIIQLTDEELSKKIVEIKDLLRKPKLMREKEINPHNLKSDLLKFQAQKRSLEYGDDASYVSWDEQGRPEFYYLRKGSTFFPMKWDVDTSTIYTASDNKKKKSVLLLRNKENKYATKKFVEITTIVFLIILVVVGIVEIWGAAKMFSSYDDSEIAALKRACVNDMLETSKAIQVSAENVARITTSIEGKFNTPDIIIDGIAPK